jgi:hypothetical protein
VFGLQVRAVVVAMAGRVVLSGASFTGRQCVALKFLHFTFSGLVFFFGLKVS